MSKLPTLYIPYWFHDGHFGTYAPSLDRKQAEEIVERVTPQHIPKASELAVAAYISESRIRELVEKLRGEWKANVVMYQCERSAAIATCISIVEKQFPELK